jgi:CHASE2 domain-containing sensor protein
VAVDLLLPAAWSQSQAFSQMVLRRADALALAAVSTAEGVVVGPECLSPLTVAALGAERVFRLFAFVNVGEDEDGITRRGYLGFRDQAGLERKAFAARAAELIGSSSAGLVSEGSRFWIDHSVDFAQFEKLSWKDLTEALDRRPSLFKDRLVIVGAEFAASGDEIHRIPATSSQPAYVSGLGLQSMMVHTILNGLPVRELPASSTVVFLILVTATVGAGLLCCGRLHFAIFLLAAGALLWVSITVLFFLSSRTVIPIAGPVLTMVIAGGTGLILRLKLRGFPKGESI